jgi:hypothetical protein
MGKNFDFMLSRSDDHYPQFLDAIKENFDSAVLFITNAEGLYEAYLNNLPAAKQVYTCSACRNFINHYGSLVTIINGEIKSVLWNENKVPDFFKSSVKAMRKIVENSQIIGVFISSQRILGNPVTGDWNHISVSLPVNKVFTSRLKTAGQVMAEKKEDFNVLKSGLQEYNYELIKKVVALLKTETVYRSDRFIGIAEWFEKLHSEIQSNKKNTDNIIWKYVATAPTGFCHIKNSAIGTLLEDLKNGYSISIASERFKSIVNPSQYMRSQVAPTVGNIERAETIVEKLGIKDSLKRRFATLDEVQTIWRDHSAFNLIKREGVFANIAPKQKEVTSDYRLPSSTMTWEKFAKTVLPDAEKIEVLVDNPAKFMALITGDESSENILQWDNRFSWYYHGGIDSEIKRRVEQAGGRYENNEIRCSLIWEGPTDLDLHCIVNNAQHIFFANRRIDYGWLDVDANGGHITSYEPVENIRWPINNAPVGRYEFYVHNYTERGKGTTPYKVELEINGKVYTYNGVASSTGYKQTIFEFYYTKGKPVDIQAQSVISDSNWNVPVNTFVKVNAITLSPNLWGKNPVEHIGKHVFFILDNCKDLSEGKGRGFFAEMLKSDLKEIRKTLDAYTANTTIENSENAAACGVGYSNQGEWNLTLKVYSNNSERIIKIDRID